MQRFSVNAQDLEGRKGGREKEEQQQSTTKCRGKALVCRNCWILRWRLFHSLASVEAQPRFRRSKAWKLSTTAATTVSNQVLHDCICTAPRGE